MSGHDFQIVQSMRDAGPTQVLCGRCGAEWKMTEAERRKSQALEVQRNILANAMRMMTTAGSVIEGDPLSDAYLAAGGGYEGLQAVAEKALDLADQAKYIA